MDLDDRCGRIWKEAIETQFKGSILAFSGGAEENHEKLLTE
jgi:hypothetical protein